jgi:hypothetical protein
MPVASLPFFILLCFVLPFFIVSFDIGSLAIVPLAIGSLAIVPLACANAAVVARESAVASAATITFFMTCLLCWQWIKNPQFLRHDSNNGRTRRTVDLVDGGYWIFVKKRRFPNDDVLQKSALSRLVGSSLTTFELTFRATACGGISAAC